MQEPLFQPPLENPTPEQRLFLQQIRELIREELAKYEHPCRFGAVTDADAGQLPHFMGMVKDLGGGRLSDGFEAMRDNHKWLREQRQLGGRVKYAVAIFIAISAAGAVISGVVLAARQLLLGK